jgi:2-polyprenyl-3-methyl-5-hydroxy-6-metoxy-1,4-benzoquinol methylase
LFSFNREVHISSLSKTGERLVPEDINSRDDQLQFLRHLAAYEFVKGQLSSQQTVLEVGCGEGYGSNYLSKSCKEIIGIDVEISAIEHAKKKYTTANCSFKEYNGSNIPYSENHFDFIVSFQVIEHVDNDAAFVKELGRVLKPGGTAFITTPNKTYRLKPGQKPWNRYHKREYYPKELETVIQKTFPKAVVWGVFGNEEITQIEFNRVKTGLLLSIVARLQIRRLMPESLDFIIARMIRTLKGKKIPETGNKDFIDRYTLADFTVKGNNVEGSLDLMGICKKD